MSLRPGIAHTPHSIPSYIACPRASQSTGFTSSAEVFTRTGGRYSARQMTAANRPKVLYTPRPQEVASLATEQLRSAFLIEDVVSESAVSFTFTDLDRLALCGVQP